MKKNYHLDDLEAFLADSADEHRMYPSDRVWRNIDKELHGQKKWPALTFGALLTGAIITAGLILVHPDKNLLHIDPNQPVISAGQKVAPSPSQSSLAVGVLNGKSHRETDMGKASDNYTAPVSSAAANTGHYSFNEAGFSNQFSSGDIVSSGSDLTAGNFEYEVLTPLNGVQLIIPETVYPNAGIAADAAPVEADEISAAGILPAETLQNGSTEHANSGQVPQLNGDKNKNRWAMEYYVTPSYSYRYLTETKIVDLHQSQQNNGPIAPNLINAVNNFVSHRPTLGIEMGTGVVYQATSKLQVRAGLQFNMRGYTIDAFAAGIEPSTIVLNRGYYTDSIFALSSYSTQSGYKEVSFENRYWQVAIPIGINYMVTNAKKINLGITASLQPTYQFSNSEYILSHDYRNYVQQPDLVRNWNLNTAIGAIISYQTRGLTWEAGPQIRYQVLSGTVTEYPIREHLLDYGFKIGVVKTLK